MTPYQTQRALFQPGGLPRALVRFGAAFIVGLALLWFGGLLDFIAQIERPAPAPELHADGIVVLTGGAERLNVALDLLEHGEAQRLLITGVHPQIGPTQLTDVTIGTAQLFKCCVDLGKTARNTHENASEAASWASEHNYRRLIVVTANYHMPRTLVEFRAAMPHNELIAYPVAPREFMIGDWWRHPGTTSLLASEYSKYVLSLVRTGAQGQR